MSSQDVSRRGFLSTAVGIGTTGAIPSEMPATSFPERAWIILEQHWEHNDEFFVSDGEHAHFQLFYSESDAVAECRRLCDEFCATESPADYRDEMESYLEAGTYDPDQVTWDQLRAAGYPGPYRVQALHTPDRKAPS
jgi:hypothetical protein